METNTLNSLAKLDGYQTMGVSTITGSNVIQSLQLPTGWNLQVAVRELNGLYIVEGFAQGVAKAYLSQILIYSKDDKTLLADIQVPHGTDYTRHTAASYITDELTNYICRACEKTGETYDIQQIKNNVIRLVDDCYFHESYDAALTWAKEVGIF